MLKVGLSTTGKNISEELFESYQKAGIEAMEVSTDYNTYNTLDYPKLKQTADKFNVEISSFHLPFKPFEVLDLSSFDKEKREKSVLYYTLLIKKLSAIGVTKYVLHSGGKVTRKSQSEVDERIKYAKESYALLAEVAQKAGGVIAVENLPPVCVGKDIAEIKELLSADPRLRVCFDTNHLLPGDPCRFIKAFADKIITIHISDYDLINERHYLPGEGVLNWQNIYNALKDINYKGIWLYEVPFSCPPTLIRERDLTCEDFVKNANEIFENKKITVLSRPKSESK